MASIRRERLFEEYRNRRIHADTLFKRALWAMLIPFGGLLAALTLYYFIRGLAIIRIMQYESLIKLKYMLIKP